MTTRNYSSTAQATTLTTDASNAATTLSVAATAGFPSAPFLLCLDVGTPAQEIVLVTAVTGLALTVTRGYDSTMAVSHATGATVTHTHSAVDFRDSRTHEAASAAHGVSSAVVGVDDAQVVTHKDLSSATNTFTEPLAIARSGKDTNGIFTTVTYARSDATTALTSVLSGGTSPLYTTRTVTEYEADGATIRRSTVFTLSYDTDGALTTEAR